MAIFSDSHTPTSPPWKTAIQRGGHHSIDASAHDLQSVEAKRMEMDERPDQVY